MWITAVSINVYMDGIMDVNACCVCVCVCVGLWWLMVSHELPFETARLQGPVFMCTIS